MAGRYKPSRGDIVWLSFTPQAGHEQAGRRPSLVISPKSYNEKTSLALVAPITSQIKGYPFEVVIPSGSRITGAILADQLRSLDWKARKASFICPCGKKELAEVLEKVMVLLLQG